MFGGKNNISAQCVYQVASHIRVTSKCYSSRQTFVYYFLSTYPNETMALRDETSIFQHKKYAHLCNSNKKNGLLLRLTPHIRMLRTCHNTIHDRKTVKVLLVCMHKIYIGKVSFFLLCACVNYTLFFISSPLDVFIINNVNPKHGDTNNEKKHQQENMRKIQPTKCKVYKHFFFKELSCHAVFFIRCRRCVRCVHCSKERQIFHTPLMIGFGLGAFLFY